MRGTRILIVFFLAFTAATMLMPAPMFPGNILCELIGPRTQAYANILSAPINGAIYGSAMWLVFLGLSRKLAH